MSEFHEIRREPVGEGATCLMTPNGGLHPAEHTDDSGLFIGGTRLAPAASSTPPAGHFKSVDRKASARGRRRSIQDAMPEPGLTDGTPFGGNAEDDEGRTTCVAQSADASSSTTLPGHITAATQIRGAGHAAAVAELVALSRRRGQWTKAIQKIVLQEQAICRSLCDGDKDAARKMWSAVIKGEGDPIATLAISPLIGAREVIEAEVAPVERVMKKLARSLPAYEWVKSVHGFGEMGFALIVGNAGDLSNYSNPAKLWKRLGLAVINGERQRKVSGDAALEHGYSPTRRSMVWNVGNGVIGGMGLGKRPLVGEDIDAREDWTEYERLFVKRLRIEAEKNPEHRRPDTKDGKESYSKHAAARAKRYVEKRLLRDLWAEWRRATSPVAPCGPLPAADLSPQGDALGPRGYEHHRPSAGGDHSANKAGPMTRTNAPTNVGLSSANSSAQAGHPASDEVTSDQGLPGAELRDRTP